MSVLRGIGYVWFKVPYGSGYVQRVGMSRGRYVRMMCMSRGWGIEYVGDGYVQGPGRGGYSTSY